MSDVPIEEVEFVHGVDVVRIEDLRIARGMSRRPKSSCLHTSLVYDVHERRIWCKDCESDVDSFDAFRLMAERAHEHHRKLSRREDAVKEAEAFQVRSRAAKVMDKAWRKRSMVPACPHCRKGIFPEDVVRGVSYVGRDFAGKQRDKAGK